MTSSTCTATAWPSAARATTPSPLTRDSLVRFSAGDGKDAIYSSLNTTIELGAGLNPDNTMVEITGNVANIRFAEGEDSITVHLLGSRPATLSFADGSTMTLTGEAPAIAPKLSELGVELRR